MIPDTLINALSEARYEKAIRAEIGLAPKFHKGKYGGKFDYHTCGQCGATIQVISDYCHKCGYRVLWENPRCLTGIDEVENDEKG